MIDRLAMCPCCGTQLYCPNSECGVLLFENNGSLKTCLWTQEEIDLIHEQATEYAHLLGDMNASELEEG